MEPVEPEGCLQLLLGGAIAAVLMTMLAVVQL